MTNDKCELRNDEVPSAFYSVLGLLTAGQETMKGMTAVRFSKARIKGVCKIPAEGIMTSPTRRPPRKDPKRSIP